MKSFTPLLIIVCFILMIYFPEYLQAQQVSPEFGSVYTGQPFMDIDFLRSYRPSPEDRKDLKIIDGAIKQAIQPLVNEPGDYDIVVTDESFVFDSTESPKNIERKETGLARCWYCLFERSPLRDRYMIYQVQVGLNLKENTTIYNELQEESMKASEIEMAEYENKLKKNSHEKTELNNEHEAHIKEFEKMGDSFDMNKYRELLKKGEKISKKYNTYDNKVNPDKYAKRNRMAKLHCTSISIRIFTNEPMLGNDLAEIKNLKNNPDFVLNELKIKGCTYACTYFSKSGNTSKYYSNKPVFYGYTGKVLPNDKSYPKPYLKPNSVIVKFSASERQITEIISKIDFEKLNDLLSQYPEK